MNKLRGPELWRDSLLPMRLWRHRLAEPLVLFSTIGLLIVLIIFSSAYFLVSREQDAIKRQIELSIGDIADTYEARVLRSLREIDATLKLVDFVASQQRSGILETLQERNLLPPELIFTVSLIDSQGAVKESTALQQWAHPGGAFASLPQAPGLLVEAFSSEGRQQLLFARMLTGERDTPEWVTLTVGADYFVSGYDAGALGAQGLLALVDASNMTRIGRSGTQLYSSIAMALPAHDEILSRGDIPFLTNWLGVERTTVVRPLYLFPLSIVVGISVDERLAEANQITRRYWQRAIVVSAASLFILGLLARLSIQLQRERQLVTDERLRHTQYIEHLAFHDTLTNLPNRAYFSYLVNQTIQQQDGQESGFALLFLDLDHFKHINDSLGHDAGDQLLQVAAKRLVSAVREQDVVARLGGDEFVILLKNVTQREQVTRVTDHLIAAMQSPFALAGESCQISVSIGVALFPTDGENEKSLMKCADMAMYQAKKAGKNGMCFYTESALENYK
ncbi:diguanylate cyclase [Vreelandella aquamarina]|uniref:diguanylate cyclase domain-containing protein n=1 Tax=Vreelandella aquamarina TaxID=77097 RepID=UPI00384A4EF2